MALSKGKALAIAMGLAFDSELRRSISAAPTPDQIRDSVAARIPLTEAEANGVNWNQLIFHGQLNTNPQAIRQAFAAEMGPYGGGPCPSRAELDLILQAMDSLPLELPS
ncbi:hypothetical protein [Paludibaculum fermentans]|uniref:Uncharacterized protein n=1 Tax=Paludibaculum fermentans TaxID=1473598 RepID=A0A7S7SHX9_PALFE|nr:hypothetical protein [Paludibaculum fermentans]QOY85118.1 hypothetical protein IRI77_19985 [Paludibaculum fermentans]